MASGGYVMSALVDDTRLAQTATLTANLAQAAATYTLGTVSGGDILITGYSFYMATAGATFTSVQVKTNQTTPTDLMTAVEGAVANLGAQKAVVVAREQPLLLKSGQLLQYVIVGATGTGSMTCTFTYLPITAGARLT